MIRVRMVKSAAGPDGSYPVHSTPLLDEDTALAFLEAGAAETFVPTTKREKAAAARQPAATVTRLDGKPLERGPDGLIAGDVIERSPEEAAEIAPIASASPDAPAVTGSAEDPLEAQRQADFKELVDAGVSEEEARAMVWPKEEPPVVERAVVTPPETAVAAPQRTSRRK